MVTSQTRRNMITEEKNEAIRLEKLSIRLQKQLIRLKKEAIRLGKEEIRLQKESIRLEKEAPKLDEEGFYQLEDVRQKRVRKGQTQYLIKWLGWPEKDNTWEPIENLQQCLDVVTAFEERLPLRARKRNSCSQDDRNFTFEVGSQPHPSERTGDDQRPFPTDLPCASQSSQGSPPRETTCQIESKMLSHVTQGSPSTKEVTQVNSKMSSHASHGSPRKSGWKKARKSSKGHKPADDTTTAGTDAPYGNGSPLKNQPLLCHKESHEEPISCIPHDPGKIDLLKEDRSFTLKVTAHAHLVETEMGNGRKPFPSLQPNDVLQTGVTSPIMSSFCQTDLNTIQDISFANTQTSVAKSERRRSWANGKARSGSVKVVDRVTAKEGEALKGVTAREQIKGSGGNSLGTLSPCSFGVVNCVAPAEEMRPLGFKPSPVPTGQTSSLPDLNASIPTSALFQHPLTDSQQVQLRAQIFVYGSLIDGTKPDEACMISAFGESDGGRSIWENVWRVAVFQHQKSPLSNGQDSPSNTAKRQKVEGNTVIRCLFTGQSSNEMTVNGNQMQDPPANEEQTSDHASLQGSKLPAQKTRSFCQSDTFSTPGQASDVGAPPTMISPPVWELEIKQREKAQLQTDFVVVLQQKVEELENKNKELQEQLESVLRENRVLRKKT